MNTNPPMVIDFTEIVSLYGALEIGEQCLGVFKDQVIQNELKRLHMNWKNQNQKKLFYSLLKLQASANYVAARRFSLVCGKLKYYLRPFWVGGFVQDVDWDVVAGHYYKVLVEARPLIMLLYEHFEEEPDFSWLDFLGKFYKSSVFWMNLDAWGCLLVLNNHLSIRPCLL